MCIPLLYVGFWSDFVNETASQMNIEDKRKSLSYFTGEFDGSVSDPKHSCGKKNPLEVRELNRKKTSVL